MLEDWGKKTENGGDGGGRSGNRKSTLCILMRYQETDQSLIPKHVPSEIYFYIYFTYTFTS